MFVPFEYNIGGLMGLGEYVLLEVIGQITDVRDLYNFLCINKKTYGLKDHQRFLSVIENCNFQDMFKRALIVLGQGNKTIVNLNSTDQEKMEINSTVLDLRTRIKDPNIFARRIKKLILISYTQKVDESKNFISGTVFYINGLNQMKAELCIFPLNSSQIYIDKSNEWFSRVLLPPEDVQFLDIQSTQQFSLALTDDSKIWSRGIKDNGTLDKESQLIWRLNPNFNYKDGLIPSSLGPSKIRQISISDINSQAPVYDFDGFIELTDSSKMKQKFTDSRQPYGIFGYYHVEKHIPSIQQFLTSDGTVMTLGSTKAPGDVIRYFYYEPLDLDYSEGGQIERIVEVENQGGIAYFTDSGKVITFIQKDTYFSPRDDLLGQEEIFCQPFPVHKLKTLLLVDQDYFVFLKKDGQIINISRSNRFIRDVTDKIAILANTDEKAAGMKIEDYYYGSGSGFYLFN
ncbi:MAG: hypothetical protein EZS28_017217 [Streblomastix strix]|uniref:Uncharacterized protein n=1 Tax=Streblomastix strix TaxID=222440 RepID=A0A5J4VX13_9EUKA|nr:MAG: hypothetical protein EZS28_017217 [Streblomastix strix]